MGFQIYRKAFWITFACVAVAEKLDSNTYERKLRRITKPKPRSHSLNKIKDSLGDNVTISINATLDGSTLRKEIAAKDLTEKALNTTGEGADEQLRPKMETSATDVTTGNQMKQHIPAVAAVSTLCRKILIKFLDNPLKLGKTMMQLGLFFVFSKIIFESFQEAMKEFKDLKDETNASLQLPSFWKASSLAPVLELLQKEEALSSAVDSNLYRIARRLQVVTRWPIYKSEGVQSIESFLLSLSRFEWLILEQCLYLPSVDLTKNPLSFQESLVEAKQHQQNMWNQIYGLSPHIPQCLHDRLACLQQSKQSNIIDPYSSLWQQSAGVLLYGPPGNGKTMLLEALKATPFLPCLSLTPSIILDKYVGETNHHVRALFSLIQKLSSSGTTTLLVVDELDGLFRERRYDEHEYSRQMKTEFLQWWDQCSSKNEVLVVGATNRPYEVDPAVLRRLSQSYLLDRPNASQRYAILSSVLNTIPHAGFSDETGQTLAAMSEGFCSSDLIQWISMAVQQGPLRDGPRGNSYRPLTKNDLLRSRISPTRLQPQYLQALARFHQGATTRGQLQSSQSTNQPSYHHQQQQQPMMVQHTPWGNFYHAGTHVMDHSQYDDDEETEFSSDDSVCQDEEPDEEQEEESLDDFNESDY